MDDENNSDIEHAEVFQLIAGHLNQLPPEQRAEIRTRLGEYTHDLKHTLGLVMGANAMLLRDEEVVKLQADMLEIIQAAAKQLNEYFTVLVENLPNQLEVDE